MAWTYERVEMLTILWKNGNSASQIAKELGGGVSRNAVIGKIHRLGLSERNDSSKDNNNRGYKKASQNRETLADNSATADEQHVNIDEKQELDIKFVKRRGRRPTQRSSNRNQNPTHKRNKNDSTLTDDKEQFSEVNESSELDQAALANMIELEKRAKKLNLMELTERTCKWPIGDPATENFWFCGHQAENGKPYCTTHVAIAFQPVSTRRERKQR